MPNPFFHGDPVPVAQFIGRKRELRRITGRLLNHGQSTAIVGEPRTGKTSLLHYISAPEPRQALYGEHAERFVFSFLDSQIIYKFSQAQFWEQALTPLYAQCVAPDRNSPLATAYWLCQQNQFGAFVLEKLLAQLEQAGKILVLMLDEFDALLEHSSLNNAEFFGSLRSLASRAPALALIVASRQPLAQMNSLTQEYNRTGSPYFNFLDEIVLGPLTNKETTDLLKQDSGRFSPADRQFLAEVCGGHPFLLQVAAAALWDSYEDEDDATARLKATGKELNSKAQAILGDTWRLWTPQMKLAVATLALVQVPELLENRKFDGRTFLRQLQDLGPELRLLERLGVVAEDSGNAAVWRIRAAALLWWLTDEITRMVRDEKSADDFIRSQQWEGILKVGEKEKLAEFAQQTGAFLKGSLGKLMDSLIDRVAGSPADKK